MTEAALDAALELLTERSFADLSMDAIAERAGVGKPALYRRFSGKAELVAAALATRLRPLESAPRDGDARGWLRQLVEALQPPDPAAYAGLLGGLMAEHRRHPELVAAFRERVLEPRRAAVRAALAAGQLEGSIRDDLDMELAVDLLGGAFLARAHTGMPMDRGWRERLFESWWAFVARP